MVATELITGMEDIVQHIKELEIKNKKLEEEKAEWIEYANENILEKESLYQELKQENKKLEGLKRAGKTSN